MNEMIYIYSPSNNTVRLNYVICHIFNSTLGIDYTIIPDKEDFMSQSGACINYSNEDLRHGLWIIPHGLLFEKGVRAIPNVEVSKWNDYFCFFGQKQGDVPFDIFAATFYLLTSYEEYTTSRFDEHGRFDLKASMAHRNGFLEIPIVDRWTYLLADEIKIKYPKIKFKKRGFRFISTIDVDFPYEYLKKGLVRTIGGTARDLLRLKFTDVVRRLSVHLRIKPDAYMEAIRWIDCVHRESGKPFHLFVLMEEGGRCGRKICGPPETYYSWLKQLRSLKNGGVAVVGMHPSYDSNEKPELFVTEKKRLKKVIGEDIAISRQHFLRIRIPETFHRLVAAGIREDFTMAFAHAPGFRSGTAIPYYFYDAEEDRTIELLLHPTTVMDTSLITHLGLSQEKASEKIKRLIDECRQSGGDFVSIWHNSNLAGSNKKNPWKKVFIDMFHYANSIENDTFVL